MKKCVYFSFKNLPHRTREELLKAPMAEMYASVTKNEQKGNFKLQSKTMEMKRE